jgi:hypothetical protein
LYYTGAKLAGANFGFHEYGYWFGDKDKGHEGYLTELDRLGEGPEARSTDDHGAYATFKELEQKGIHVQVLQRKINHPSNLDMLRGLAPDLIFSARFLHIFKEQTLAIPTYGVLNMHPGLLPDYRYIYTSVLICSFLVFYIYIERTFYRLYSD